MNWLRTNSRSVFLGFLFSVLYHITIVPLAWSQHTESTDIFVLGMVAELPGFIIATPIAFVSLFVCNGPCEGVALQAIQGFAHVANFLIVWALATLLVWAFFTTRKSDLHSKR